MSQITGTYLHEKNENIDEYFKALGVPYIARKMIAMSHPTMEISECEGVWTIKNIALMKTTEIKFKLNEEYDEPMPGGLLKTITTLEDGKLISLSTSEDGTKIKRIYEFSEHQMIVSLVHEASGQTAKRYFKKAEMNN